jgi:mycofactocin precursor
MSQAEGPDTNTDQATDNTSAEAESDDEPEITADLVSEKLRIDGICGVH